MVNVARTENFQSAVANTPGTSVVVGQSSTQILGENLERLQFWISNNSKAANIYISLGGEINDDAGVCLVPGAVFNSTTYTGSVNAWGELYPMWISSIVGNGTTASLTASRDFNNVENGDTITIVNNSNSNFNGNHVVYLDAPNILHFASSTNATSTGGAFYNNSDAEVGVVEV